MALSGDTDTFVLLENSRPRRFGDGRSLLFTDLINVVECHQFSDVPAALEQIETAAQGGLHAAGYLSYELGYGFEQNLRALAAPPDGEPLLWFGLFRSCATLDAAARKRFWADRKERRFVVRHVQPNISEDEYLAAVAQVQEHLRCGDTYQINLTFKLGFHVDGDPFALMYALSHSQPVEYGALINSPERKILSLSPELFLRKTGDQLTSKPMKGTWPRGIDLDDDADHRQAFAADQKTRAENLMIVDLIRNDLSRISNPGTVEVRDRFAIETYRTLFQMTSTVGAQIKPDTSFQDVVRALYPCGSITGAPKIRSMEIIRDLELATRGVYTGAIGFVSQGTDGTGVDYCFNVPIRTLVLDNKGWGEMGVGSGIVADSDPKAEYQECLLKARFLTDPPPPVQLIETMLWQPTAGIWLLDRHLDRLSASAQYFQIPFEGREVRALIDLHLDAIAGTTKRRVRLLLGEGGGLSITSEVLEDLSGPQTVRISQCRTRSDDMFLRHKTTNRAFYNRELAAVREAGHFEILFQNERDELTEGSITNLFVEKDGVLLTPPLNCGLLAGTFRHELMEGTEYQVEEMVLCPSDLENAENIYVGNSVRGLVPVQIAD